MTFLQKRPQRGFSTRQKEILMAIAQTLFPSAVGTPLRLSEGILVRQMEDFLSAMGRGTLLGYGTLLLLFEYAALFLYPKLKPFTRLSPSEQERYMAGWENSRLMSRRYLLIMLKFLVCIILLDDKDARAALGYDSKCLAEQGR